MICYHGLPFSGAATFAARALQYRDAMVSFATPSNLPMAAEVCRTVALDNGAFTAWKSGNPITDWSGYYEWIDEWKWHPSIVWACIPDVIDGNESDNDELLLAWPFGHFGVPVWHLHESIARLERLASGWTRVALGSSGEYAQVADDKWWHRMTEVMDAVCDVRGRPMVALHGLRMLDPTILAHLPLASADSTNIGRNIGLDSRWKGAYTPPSLDVRAVVMMDRLESHAKAHRWCGTHGRQKNFELIDCAESMA